MKLSNIRDILAVAETGSLRAASRKLGITQPSMTRSIRDTENEVGASLFTRHAHGVVPTEMGKLFVRRAMVIQTEVRRILEELQQAKGEFTGNVSIAMSTAASMALMPAILRTFQKEYPKALLRVSESLFHPIEAALLSGEIDFFVGPLHAKYASTSLVIEKLFDNRRLIVARKGHPLAGARSLQDLRDARWIRPSFSDRRDEADFDALFERAGLEPPNVVMQTKSIMLTLLAIAHSDLLTVLPLQWLDMSITSDAIETIVMPEQFQAAPVCLVRRGDLPLTPLAERLCDLTIKAGFNYARRFGSTGPGAGSRRDCDAV